jgi:glutamine synthetase
MTTLERIPSGVAAPTSTVADVMSLAREAGVLIVDLRFVDLPGQSQHFSIPVKDLGEDLFIDGIGFDGSSIRGFQHIHESDMLLMPDPTTAYVDPTLDVTTLILSCDVVEPGSRTPYSRDPRYVARKAERYLAESGIATTSFWGPEVEFYIFDSLRFETAGHKSMYEIDSDEGIWNSSRNGTSNLAHRPRPKEGYFPVPPMDTLQDLRSKMVLALQASGIDVEVQHHEVGGPGQAEIDIRYGTLVETADKVLRYKYLIKQVAHAAGKVATFMPKPLFGDNGSGMHTHQSLWKDGTNLFYDENGYALLSDTARWYIGGL